MSTSTTEDKKNDLIPDYLDELIEKKHGFKKDVKVKQMITFICNDINKNPKVYHLPQYQWIIDEIELCRKKLKEN